MKSGKSSESWKYEAFNQVYEGHLAELNKIQGDNPQCYHLILNRLFSKCVYVWALLLYTLVVHAYSRGDTDPAPTQQTVSKNDYRDLDPANL